MIKYFCDVCGIELTDKNDCNFKEGRIVGKYGVMIVEVITGKDPTWNAGNFCRDCVGRALISVINNGPQKDGKISTIRAVLVD